MLFEFKSIHAAVNVDLTSFSSEEVSMFHYFVSNGWSYMLVLTHTNPEDIPCDSRFYEKTLKLLKLTRSALLYLSSILYEEESLKSPLGGVGTIEMEEL